MCVRLHVITGRPCSWSSRAAPMWLWFMRPYPTPEKSCRLRRVKLPCVPDSASPVPEFKSATAMADDEIHYPAGFGLKDVVAWGSTGLVVLDSATQTVIKTPFNPEDSSPIRREREIYERLAERGRHQGILSYHGGVDGGGIRLEYASNHDLQSFIEQQHPDRGLRLCWMFQLADALAFIHDAGIIHRLIAAPRPSHSQPPLPKKPRVGEGRHLRARLGNVPSHNWEATV